MTSVGQPDPLAEFFAEQRGPGSTCRMKTVLERLPPEKADLLRKALATPSKTLYHSTIATTLGKWGIDVGPATVSRHRNRECHCVSD